MPWPVYTETFVRASTPGTTVVYTVPAGRRAVIKAVTAVSAAGVAARAFVRVAGFYIVQRTLQAATDFLWTGTVVAYHGQLIEVTPQDASVHICVSGYMFAEGALLRGGEPPRVTEKPADPADEVLWPPALEGVPGGA